MRSLSTIDRGGVRLRIEGRVQGVGFRWWTEERAVELGLTGTVRNLPDGSVEIVAFGSSEALARLTQLAHDGPPSASVARVEQEPLPAETAAPHDFRILP